MVKLFASVARYASEEAVHGLFNGDFLDMKIGQKS